MVMEIELTQGKIALIDDCDADLADFKWYALTGGNTFYAARKVNKKHLYIHRVILSRILDEKLTEGDYCDHRNGNGLDNRRNNLRVCNHIQNVTSCQIYKNNTSGYKGVSFDKQVNKWKASIRYKGVLKNIGRFDTPEKAYEAYCEAALKYFGDFARFE